MPDNKDQIIENLQKEVEELKRIIEMQNDIIRDLREQLRKNSGNSSSLHHLMDLRKSQSIRIGVYVRKVGRKKADRMVIPAHILPCFQSRIMSSTIFTLTVSVVRSERFA